jgi:hypothetical protein
MWPWATWVLLLLVLHMSLWMVEPTSSLLLQVKICYLGPYVTALCMLLYLWHGFRCFDCAVCVKPTLLKTPTRLGIVIPSFFACTVFLKLLGDVANITTAIRRWCRERVKFLKLMGGRFLRMDTLALLLSLVNVRASAEESFGVPYCSQKASNFLGCYI